MLLGVGYPVRRRDEPATKLRLCREVCGRTTRPTGASFAYRLDTPKITNFVIDRSTAPKTILERPWGQG
jgi:hypothetical protein